MSEVYGVDAGVTAGIQDLHNMALAGYQSALAQREQESLRQDQLASQVWQKQLAQQGRPQQGQPMGQPMGQPPVGVMSPQGFAAAGQPGTLGSPGGSAAPIQQQGQQPQGQQPQGPRPDQAMVMADTLLQHSTNLMQAGLPKQGTAALEQSLTIRKNVALAHKDQIESQLKEEELRVSHVKMAAGYAQRAMAQAGGDTPLAVELAKSMMLQEHPEFANDPELAQFQWQPNILTGLVQQSLSGDQYLNHIRNSARDQIDKLDKEQQRATGAATEKLRLEQVRAAKAKNDELLKNGGRTTAQAAAAERLQMTEGKSAVPEVMIQFPDMGDAVLQPHGSPAQLALANVVGDKAKKFLNDGQAKTWAEAKGQAVVRVLAEKTAEGKYKLPQEEQTWVDAQMKANPGWSKADIIEEGYRRGAVGKKQ